MLKMKPMKLEGALKLYMVLYFLAFLSTFMTMVPMLLHVVPESECLLFVSYSDNQNTKNEYGPPGGCYAVGLLPLIVAVGALGLMFVQYFQLARLRDHLRNPEMSSDEYRYTCRKMFWRMIVVHGCLGAVVLAVASILSTGYALTCRNLYLWVEKEIRHRLQTSQNQYAGQQQQKVHEVFASDQKLNRYASGHLNTFGQNRFETSITCRSLLTDSTNHYKLKKNHRNNDFYSQYDGYWQTDQDLSDIGNFQNIAFTDNLRVECAMAGAWLAVVLWSLIMFLMMKERHHLRAHITDQSMWGGSEYNHSVKSGKSRQSRHGVMTPVDFDVRSNASRVSKGSRSSRGTSYKDMGGGGKRSTRGGSSSYKNMSQSRQTEPPSRLTISRLEQVPSLPPDHQLKKLLAGGEPPNDTSSVANMSMMTVTGTVFGPGMEAARQSSRPNNSGLMDYFNQQGGQQQQPQRYNESDEDAATRESEVM